jgi:hypothetical protein
MLFSVPQSLANAILHEWVTVKEICRLEAAFPSNSVERLQLLSALSRCSCPCLYSTCSTMLYVAQYQKWLNRINIEVESLVSAAEACRVLLKALPVLRNVSGSSSGSATALNAHESRGVYYYTANSMQSIIDAMKIERCGRGIRFVDVGCGSSVFLATFQMCQPEAQVRSGDVENTKLSTLTYPLRYRLWE